uniref:Uncharacterized protein n=1 Tax=Pararge aegeria TaxID=116150 RepID=S4PEL3_9NEOP
MGPILLSCLKICYLRTFNPNRRWFEQSWHCLRLSCNALMHMAASLNVCLISFRTHLSKKTHTFYIKLEIA